MPDIDIAKRKIERLIIVPDGDFHLFPFGSLSTQEHGVLAEHLTTVRTSSVSRYFGDRAEVTSSSGIGVFSDPNFNLDTLAQYSNDASLTNWYSQFQRLPWTAEIGSYIQDLFPKTKVKHISGANATNSELLSYPMRNSQILHIATHAYYDKENPELVGLVTAPQIKNTADSTIRDIGYLSIHDVLDHPFHSELIVISACESQMGKNYGGEGVRGLAYSFLAQGAGSVIGTLWKIPDKPTALFMQRFYKALKDNGGNSVKALQAARQSFIRSGRYKHPKYWAGFVLTVANRQYEKIYFN